MKKLLFLAAAAFLFFTPVLQAQAPAQDQVQNQVQTQEIDVSQYLPEGMEKISSFDTLTVVNPDGGITVEERILYDFGDDNRHGIYRNIPFYITNADGKQYEMDVQVLSVVDGQGLPYKYTTSESSGELSIKIGDPDKTITGENMYIILYSVKGALRYFSDHDELYWNNTGNEWTVPIVKSSSRVKLGVDYTVKPEDGICYTGVTGSQDQACTVAVEDNLLITTASTMLQPGEGLTSAFRFPKGLVQVMEPKEVVPFFDTLIGKITAVLLVIAFFWWYIGYPVWLGIKWFMYGRDPNVGKAVTAWFDPPETKTGRKLTPAETGTIIDEKVETRDIAAMMVNLAQRGYYTIHEKTKNDFYFTKGKDADNKLEKYEKLFLTALLGSSTKEVRLKDKYLGATVETINSEIYDKLTAEGFFPENPKQIRGFYAVIMGLAGITFNFPLLISGALFGLNMVKKTIDGAKAANVAKGMKNFLQSQERQFKYQGDKQLLFEKLLPFAVAFGVERQWADRFQDVKLVEPDWYSGYYGNSGFNAHVFGSSLHSSVNSFATAATPVSSSTGSSSGFSGGGSSGGGGGGGGGGSW